MQEYKENSLSLMGAVSMGTGVMIGAGIFALTGQMAELSGNWFPLAFLSAAVVTAFSAYSYIKLSNAFPSAGGIGMYLYKAYGSNAYTAFFALLMYFSMVINESLVARTFGTYTLRLFDVDESSFLVPLLGVVLLIFAFLLNLSGNKSIGWFSTFMAALKVLGIALFALSGLYVMGSMDSGVSTATEEFSLSGFVAATALGILAYKGFTTITNSGGELVDANKNVGRAIMISIGVCVLLYLLVAFAVQGNLELSEIVAAKNYSLAEAARPALGDLGMSLTVVLAIVATISGVLASMFAVSRMLAMLTDMKLVPHRHFGMPGTIQNHTLVYTVVIAILLTVFMDLSRIASMGAIFYLVMDIAVHWGVLRHLREELTAQVWVVITAIVLDAIVLTVFIFIKAQSDSMVVWVSLIFMLLIFAMERLFLRSNQSHHSGHEGGSHET